MLFAEIIRVALQSVRANKLRSFLTMLGIIIGIGAVIAMVALGEGAQRQVQDRLQGLGTNVLTVRPGQAFMGGVDRGDSRLTTEHAEALIPSPDVNHGIVAVSPEMNRRQQVQFGSRNANLQIYGVWPSYFSIQNHKVGLGRLYTDTEDRSRRRVAVIGPEVGTRLGTESEALVGTSIRIRGQSFEVIGVLEPKGGTGFGSPDEAIFTPVGTAQFRLFGSDQVNAILVQAESERRIATATAEIDRIMRREQRVPPGDPSRINIMNQASLLETFEETARTFTFLLAGIALVSLIVGGIGIMNIMLVSVTERTREIGVRKALGARRRDVMLQFLVEALVLCIAGGILGLGVGAGSAYALEHFAGWDTAVAPAAVAVAFGFSAFIGIFFGIWPARRAARLDPITALRYE
jgi:putative ABC transport system permease protein